MQFKRAILAPVFLILLCAAGVIGFGQWYIGGLLHASYENQLVLASKVAVKLVNRLQALPPNKELQSLASEMATAINGRATFINKDGAVIADSSVGPKQLALMGNHADRPEVLQAYRGGIGVATRFSVTIGQALTYVAVPYQMGAHAGVIRLSFFDSNLSNAIVKQQIFFGLIAAFFVLSIIALSAYYLRIYLRRIEADRADLELALSDARQAVQAKSEFLAVISHELRTPLTSSIGSLELLSAPGLEHSQETRGELREIALRNNKSLLRLVNELLDYEKTLSGNIVIETENLDIAALTRDVLKTNQDYARTRSINFVMETPCPEAFALVNAYRFEQILANLLSNAAKFSELNQEVRVSVYIDDAMVRVDVADKGQGVAESDLNRMFDPFTQLDGSATRAAGGTGLGLTISQALTTAMGGTLVCVSELGVGSTFTLKFPYSEPARIAP